MARAAAPLVFNVGEIQQRARHAMQRIIRAVEWARSTNEVWQAFNQGGDVRWAVAGSMANEAALIYERATLDAQILQLTRVLDQEGHKGILRTNRMSLRIVRKWLNLPGVLPAFQDEARAWPNGISRERNLAAFDQRWELLENGLDRLDDDVALGQGRETRLRNFRDENIAHELHFEERREVPVYRDIDEHLGVVMRLTEAADFIVHGNNLMWRRNAGTRSSQALWAAVAAAYPLSEEAIAVLRQEAAGRAR